MRGVSLADGLACILSLPALGVQQGPSDLGVGSLSLDACIGPVGFSPSWWLPSLFPHWPCSVPHPKTLHQQRP